MMDMIDSFSGAYISNYDIYKILRKEILNLVIPPGQLISENTIAKRFDVSRTPIRSVFEMLRKDQLTSVIPRKGTFVTLLDLEMIEQIIYMRVMVEIGVMLQISKEQNSLTFEKMRANLKQQKYLIDSGISPEDFYKIDNAFHEQCMKATHKLKLWQLISHLDVHYYRYRMMDYTVTHRFSVLYEEHCQIFRYIETGQHSKLIAAIKAHLFSGLTYLGDRLITEYSSYFLETERTIYEILAELKSSLHEL